MVGEAETPGVRRALGSESRRAAEAAVAYAAAMLAVSWVLGSIREFLVLAGADAGLAVLTQAAVTLLVLAHAAGWIVRMFGLPPRASVRLVVGSAAAAIFGLLTAATVLLFGVSPLDLTAGSWGAKALGIGATVAASALLPLMRSRATAA